jgi:hypothetical protein
MRLNPSTYWTRTVELRPNILAKATALRIVRRSAGLLLAAVVLLFTTNPVQAQSPTFAGNPQHTANYAVPAQHLNVARWTTSVDLDNGGAFAHYGAPLVTASNTVIVPVRTATGFLIRAFEGANGRMKYALTNDYVPPTLPKDTWFPVYQPVLASSATGLRLYYAGPGGTIYYITDPDSDIPSAPVQQCFYTNMTGYAGDASNFNSAVVINTPLTADTNGVVFFGFRTQTNAPAPLNTTNSGFARIDSAGNGLYVLAGAAAGDPAISRDSHNCAPALSNDGTTLYVAVKGSTANYAYLLGLDSTTLATKYKVLLRDPRNHNFAGLTDLGTASPMVAPDGDVYFGVFANPNNASRGFLLHFSADLQTNKIPSGFGWDFTPAIVPTNLAPSYTGTSPYLLFSKYNNYAGSGDGNGINRIALLDPFASQTDPHSSAPGLKEMREVLTVIGVTPDNEYFGSTYPNAVREWCINTAALNPATKSVFTPSEDGHVYRWDFAANSLTEAYTLGPGVGAPYVPTVIGPDGTVYAMNGGTLFALGSYTNVSIALYSSAADLRNAVAGQPITFTAVVTNLDGAPQQPTGNVDFQFVTYTNLAPITNTVLGQPLVNGAASVTLSNFIAGSNYLGNYFVTARYQGDPSFPRASAMLVQKVHASATITALTSYSPSNNTVTFTATVTSVPRDAGVPTGMVSFFDHTNCFAQLPLDSNAVASVTVTNFTSGTHAISATYASDTMFAASGGAVVATAPSLTGVGLQTNGAVHFSFRNTIGAPFKVLGSPDISLPIESWAVLGSASETTPGHFEFTDPAVNGRNVQFYRVRSP